MLQDLTSELVLPRLLDRPSRNVIFKNLVFRKMATHFHRIKEDPDDDKVIDCAIAAGARYIISGDSHLLKVKQFKTVELVSPEQLLAQLK